MSGGSAGRAADAGGAGTGAGAALAAGALAGAADACAAGSGAPGERSVRLRICGRVKGPRI